MNINDYLKGCLQTWDGKFGQDRSVLGLCGEAGEVAEVYKKFLRGDFEREELQKRLKKEVGDVFYYATVLCFEFDLDVQQVLEENLEKLKDRKLRNKIKGDGDDR